MAAVEEAPLLRDEESGKFRDFDYRALPGNVRNVLIAFGVLSLLVALFSENLVLSLLSLVLSSYVLYYLFNNQLFERFEIGDVYQALGFLKLGIWNAWIKSAWLSILFGIPFMLVVGAYAASTNWMKVISDIGQAMDDHDGFEDMEKKDLMVHVLSVLHVKPILMRGVHHISNFRAQYRSYSGMGSADFGNKIPEIMFKDGTVANPLIAEMLDALSSIPFLFMFLVLMISQVLLHAFPQVQAMKQVTCNHVIPSTFNTVAVGSAFLGLGMSMTTFFIFSAGGGGFIFFFLPAIFNISIAAIIGMTLQKNSETNYIDEKNSVLLKPVLYKSYNGFIWGLYGIYVVKNVFPKIANMFDRGFVLPQDCSSFPFIGFCSILIVVSQIALIWYVQNEAKKMFEDTS